LARQQIKAAVLGYDIDGRLVFGTNDIPEGLLPVVRNIDNVPQSDPLLLGSYPAVN
jgi:hypothetical protein